MAAHALLSEPAADRQPGRDEWFGSWAPFRDVEWRKGCDQMVTAPTRSVQNRQNECQGKGHMGGVRFEVRWAGCDSR